MAPPPSLSSTRVAEVGIAKIATAHNAQGLILSDGAIILTNIALVGSGFDLYEILLSVDGSYSGRHLKRGF